MRLVEITRLGDQKKRLGDLRQGDYETRISGDWAGKRLGDWVIERLGNGEIGENTGF